MTNRLFAVIPARGGSKGIPGKNLVSILGKPLIAYSLEAAKAVSEIFEIIVSSDDAAILSLAEEFKVTAVERPADLATDSATTDSVLNHIFQRKDVRDTDTVVLLQPTSPLRTSEDIQRAVSLYQGAGCVVSVSETSECAFKVFTMPIEGKLVPLFSEEEVFKPRQSLPKTYKPNGAIFIFSVGDFRKDNRIPRSPLIPYLMPLEKSIDIDYPSDIPQVERLMKGQMI